MARKPKEFIENNEPHNTVKLGGNLDPLKADIAAARDKVLALKKKRADINADIQAVRTSLEAKGITKKAFDDALRHFEQDPDKRAGYDEAYIIAREAMGLAVKGAQLNLFQGGDAAADDNGQEGADADTQSQAA